MGINRRKFVQSALAGAAGLSVTGPGVKSLLASSQQGFAWTDKMPVNPDIDNMRVVCMHDPKMYGDGSSFSAQNAAADEPRVRDNMDKMAVHLTGKPTAEAAWKTIFRSSKPWADTKVMIKVNTVATNNQARVAVVKKITDTLVGYGVQPKNIVLFDGQGAAWKDYQSVTSLTDSTKILGTISNSYDSMGGRASVNIPGITAGYAPKDLVDGVTDIIVNIAVNKGHESPFNVGKTTLCLKNHFGTFLLSNGMATHLHSTNGLINSNKIKEIVGGNPVRQQLCIIDTLWAIKANVTGTVSHKPDRLVMGTFAGAVDYYCAKEIREKLMAVTNHEQNVITQFLTGFGYSVNDPEYVEVTPETVSIRKAGTTVDAATFSFTFSTPSIRQSTLRFALPAGNREPLQVSIFDMRGRLVRKIGGQPGARSMQWDGRATNGSPVPAGSYAVRVAAGGYRDTMNMTVAR
ncbi:MAG: DUF362 domain-containing protein [Chitinispirillaceae bacterium]|nr:DUF362 domain-containing protein [Chitinispirillaceae bacterium]